jgi:hypothetical protein
MNKIILAAIFLLAFVFTSLAQPNSPRKMRYAQLQLVKDSAPAKPYMDFKPRKPEPKERDLNDYWQRRGRNKAWGAVGFVVLLFAALILGKKKKEK